jgi:YVTN family beta-propeller protein
MESSGDDDARAMVGSVGAVSDTAPSGPERPGNIASGTIFAGYRIEAEIGRGGMGVVYRARHLALDRETALKVISPALSEDPRFRERFQRESRLAASLEHPNVVAVDHAGDEGGILYLSMRLVDGSDLRRIVEAEGRLDARRTARLLTGVAAGLDAAHERGLLHRDVKPANVLIEGANSEERVFLTDFGISRIAGGGTVTASGELLGSPDYVAPEQVAGDRVDYRTDVYGLGCLLHFALTGQPPFPRDNDLAKLFAHANAPRPLPSELVPGLPTALDGVVARAMAIRPEYRYESAGELAADVESIVRGAEPVAAEGPSPAPRASEEAPTRRLPRPRGRRTGAILAACIALAAAGGVAALLLSGGDHGGGSAGSGPLPVATVQVGRAPTGLAVSPARLWVASSGASALYAIDLATNRQSRPPVPAGADPVSVAVAFDSIWALNRDSSVLLRLDHLSRGGAPIEIPVGRNPSDVTFDKHWIWVANQGDDTVSRIDPDTNQVDATVHVDSGPSGIATGAGAVWVTNAGGGSVSKIDPSPAKVVAKPLPIGQHPSELAVGHGSVWVSDLSNDTVTRIHARSMKIGNPIEVGDRPTAVAIGVGYVWVANGGDSTVSRIDPRAAALAGPPIRVGRDPADVAVAMGAVWTANFDDSTVTRIRP